VVYKVGPKGQVVIAKELREKLGVEPGWWALQRLVDDHVEIHFVPPEHDRSLFGALSEYAKVKVSEEDWHSAKESAWEAAVREKFGVNGESGFKAPE
jgi:bifunctional DNA-binding transcriptional regulator/antitoxin component of YhaV-PrlF toxin-antitoxin module